MATVTVIAVVDCYCFVVACTAQTLCAYSHLIHSHSKTVANLSIS